MSSRFPLDSLDPPIVIDSGPHRKLLLEYGCSISGRGTRACVAIQSCLIHADSMTAGPIKGD